jgi:hypothetical protein
MINWIITWRNPGEDNPDQMVETACVSLAGNTGTPWLGHRLRPQSEIQPNGCYALAHNA